MKIYSFLNNNYKNISVGEEISYNEEDILLDYIFTKGGKNNFQIILKCLKVLKRKGIVLPSLYEEGYSLLKIGKDISLREEDILLEFITQGGNIPLTAKEEGITQYRVIQVLQKCRKKILLKFRE